MSYSKEYYEKNREKIIKRAKKWIQDNPVKHKELVYDSWEKNGEHHKEKQKEWKKKNRDRWNEYQRQYKKRKRLEKKLKENEQL